MLRKARLPAGARHSRPRRLDHSPPDPASWGRPQPRPPGLLGSLGRSRHPQNV